MLRNVEKIDSTNSLREKPKGTDISVSSKIIIVQNQEQKKIIIKL